jgi:hypothetical protein
MPTASFLLMALLGAYAVYVLMRTGGSLGAAPIVIRQDLQAATAKVGVHVPMIDSDSDDEGSHFTMGHGAMSSGAMLGPSSGAASLSGAAPLHGDVRMASAGRGAEHLNYKTAKAIAKAAQGAQAPAGTDAMKGALQDYIASNPDDARDAEAQLETLEKIQTLSAAGYQAHAELKAVQGMPQNSPQVQSALAKVADINATLAEHQQLSAAVARAQSDPAQAMPTAGPMGGSFVSQSAAPERQWSQVPEGSPWSPSEFRAGTHLVPPDNVLGPGAAISFAPIPGQGDAGDGLFMQGMSDWSAFVTPTTEDLEQGLVPTTDFTRFQNNTRDPRNRILGRFGGLEGISSLVAPLPAPLDADSHYEPLFGDSSQRQEAFAAWRS